MLENKITQDMDTLYPKIEKPVPSHDFASVNGFRMDSYSSTGDDDDDYVAQNSDEIGEYGDDSLIRSVVIQKSGEIMDGKAVSMAIGPTWVIKSQAIYGDPNTGIKRNDPDIVKQQDDCEGLLECIKRIRSQPKNISPFNTKDIFPLLPSPSPSVTGKKCLVLDLDETLLHSSYVKPQKYDLHLVLENNGCTETNIYTTFRPFMQYFLDFVAPLFEIVIFTASTSHYCNQLLDIIDPQKKLGNLRMYREHCIRLSSNYVKDLSLLGRDLEQVVIIDNSPISYILQHRNAIPIPSWFNDPNDCELVNLVVLLEAMVEVDNVYTILDSYNALLRLRQKRMST